MEVLEQTTVRFGNGVGTRVEKKSEEHMMAKTKAKTKTKAKKEGVDEVLSAAHERQGMSWPARSRSRFKPRNRID